MKRGLVTIAIVLLPACAPPDATSRGIVEVHAPEMVGDVYVDARDRGPAAPSTRVEVTTGTHVIELRAGSLVIASRTVEVGGGDTIEIDLDRDAVRAWSGDASIPAQLEIRSEPTAADTLVDGVREGVTPVHVVLAPGTHHVTVHADGHEVHEQDIDVPAGSASTLDVTLSPSSPR